jgi:hypothetical protein
MQPYQPANLMEGAIFMDRFCDRCRHDTAFRDGTGDSCLIAANAVALKVTDPGYPAEWIEDERGPRCTAFEREPA